MLPVEKGEGQIWRGDQFLCDVEYDISEPLPPTGTSELQRIRFTVEDKHCATLIDAYGLTLVLADGNRHAIPRPFHRVGLGSLECFVETAT